MLLRLRDASNKDKGGGNRIDSGEYGSRRGGSGRGQVEVEKESVGRGSWNWGAFGGGVWKYSALEASWSLCR